MQHRSSTHSSERTMGGKPGNQWGISGAWGNYNVVNSFGEAQLNDRLGKDF
ncbi:MAG: hypothetical protein R2793_04640 [Flavobacteriaceae bacterium]